MYPVSYLVVKCVHDFADGESDLSAVRRSAQPGVMQSQAQPGIMQSLAQPGIMQSLAEFDQEPEGAGGRAQQRGSRWGPREVELLAKNVSFLLSKHFLRKYENLIYVNFERLGLFFLHFRKRPIIVILYSHNQCCGSGSSDPYLCLRDPGTDPGGPKTYSDPTDSDADPEHW
jgi:hypothetical protein